MLPRKYLSFASTSLRGKSAKVGKERDGEYHLALALYTANPYRALCRDGYGTITEGAHADFAILESDLFAEDPQKLRDTKVRATYLEGVRTF